MHMFSQCGLNVLISTVLYLCISPHYLGKGDMLLCFDYLDAWISQSISVPKLDSSETFPGSWVSSSFVHIFNFISAQHNCSYCPWCCQNILTRCIQISVLLIIILSNSYHAKKENNIEVNRQVRFVLCMQRSHQLFFWLVRQLVGLM